MAVLDPATIAERNLAAQVVRQRKMVHGFVLYAGFISLPLVLFGHFCWAAVTVLFYLLYYIFDPTTFAPSRDEIEEEVRERKRNRESAEIRESQSIDAALQTPQGKLAFSRQRDAAPAESKDAELYRQIQKLRK
jgi:flagellar biosynthesis component FlhA